MAAVIALLAWLRAHKGPVAIAAAAFFAGYVAGHRHAQPAVHEVAQEHAAKDAVAVADTTVHKGAGRTVTLNFDPVVGPPRPSGSSVVNFPEQRGTPPDLCRPVVVPGLGTVEAPPGERLESVTIEDEGPTDTVTHAATEEHQVVDRKLDLTIAPTAAIPRVSAFWLPSVSPSFAFGTVGVDVRLTDRISVMAGAQPFAAGGPAWMVGARVGIF